MANERNLNQRGQWLRSAFIVLLCMVCGGSKTDRVGAQGARESAGVATGSSTTLLPDGRELVLGGIAGNRVLSRAWIRDLRSGAVTEIADGLRRARAWHSATVLADGTVLVLGGRDTAGHLVEQAERLDTATGKSDLVAALDWRGLEGHSATLLNAHQVLLVGGAREGAVVGDVQILDLDHWQVVPVASLTAARAYHSASLLADGRVAISGGRGADSQQMDSQVIVDINGPTISETVVPEADSQFAGIASSDPADGATDVAIQPTIMLRLSRPARVDTATQNTLVLSSASGAVAATAVAAESGRLVFVKPAQALEPGTAYLLTINGMQDATGEAVPYSTVSFTTVADSVQSSGTDDDDVWNPRAAGRLQDWRTNRPRSPWQDLSPLKAPSGITALSGQVLRLNGSPLAGVTMRLGGRTAMTDATGRFLLINETLPAGWHTLRMDGRTANGKGATYGTFDAAVRMTAGQTAVLPYTMWMPKIDTGHAVTISAPTTAETVVTTPMIPGLELHLPAGTVITDDDGRTAREISITPIPVDRPPFPLPVGTDVPIYFTIQPGGAYVAVTGTTAGSPRGARLIYPNYHGRPSGTAMEFWQYGPDEGRGWYVYGRGAVARDGKQIVPDSNVSLYRFTGAMVAPPGLAPASGPSPGRPGNGGDPVHLGTGLFVLDKTDLTIQDVLPLSLARTYRTNDTLSRAFGIGATHAYDIFLVGTVFPYTYVDLILPDGGRVHYDRISPGTSYFDAVYEHTASPTQYFKSRISWNGNGWNLDLKDGSRITFRDGSLATRPMQAAATRMQDRYGNAVTLTRNADADLTRITSPNGRWIDLTYDTSHRVTQATDNINRVVQYTYDTSGRLWKVTDPGGGVTEYTYDSSHRMLTIKDARGIVFLTNEYDAGGRVSKQTQADNSTFQFAYTLNASGQITQADVTDPRGYVRRVVYNTAGYLVSDTYAVGQSEERTTTYELQSGTNLLLATVDPLARRTEYSYDTFGSITSVTRLAGTAGAVTESHTFESTFHQLASITDPLNHTATFAHDTTGNVTSVTDPLNHQTTFTFNAAGQPLTTTTPAGATQFAYDAGDLVSVSDPLGRTTMRFVDAAGRLVGVTTPLGRRTILEYDALNRVTKTVDASGGQTTFTYDANGNLLTLTDALNHTTTYTYDNMDRVATRTDPLSRAASYVYDANGNLQQITDRKNQITTYTYDSLNRLYLVTYADTSTTTHSYDAGNRLTQVADSVAGTISRTYDLLDRFTGETTPEGTVSYTYDAAGRRATMTVSGQTGISYTYDDADRLTVITQGTSTVGFGYDAANRRTMLALPNGITVTYGYDDASQVTHINYGLGVSTLGDLTYTYDLDGSRVGVGGTWARTGLPAALASATYDAANQIATWAGIPFVYDANGNLTSDGTKAYTWNPRNQLTAMGGGVNATFEYDAFGRRSGKAISGISTNFLYDGPNLLQELSGTTPTANLLTGLAIDETFTRIDAAGTRHPVADVLGSTLALTDTAGVVQTQYTFDPFGVTTVSGATSLNTRQFTGRENDATGLYFNRARYYNPQLQRFMSEDPIGHAGGLNVFAYANNAPTYYVDALGLKPKRGFGPGPNGSGPVPPGRGPGPRATDPTIPGPPADPPPPDDRSCPDGTDPDGWFRNAGHIYMVGREGTWIPPKEGIGKIIDDYVPAGHAFGTRHDNLMGDWTALTGSDSGMGFWPMNVGSMLGAYALEVANQTNRTLGNPIDLPPFGPTCHR